MPNLRDFFQLKMLNNMYSIEYGLWIKILGFSKNNWGGGVECI